MPVGTFIDRYLGDAEALLSRHASLDPDPRKVLFMGERGCWYVGGHWTSKSHTPHVGERSEMVN
jgi:hypothetical protein